MERVQKGREKRGQISKCDELNMWNFWNFWERTNMPRSRDISWGAMLPRWDLVVRDRMASCCRSGSLSSAVLPFFLGGVPLLK